MTATDIGIQTLKELVNRYRVCWQVWPEYVMVGKEQRQVGFELELSGTHEPKVMHPTPGCEHCRQVFAALVDIAEWIMPKEKRLSRYDIDPYETAIRYSQARDYRPDVTLMLRILHREDGLNPVDACELRCLGEMKQHLREIGACEGSWVARRRNP